MYFCCISFFLNIITIFLSSIAVVLSIIYPYLKRYIYFPQLILGFLFSWPILIAYTATYHVMDSTAYLFFIANTIWVIVYDTEYAMADCNDDRKIGIKSSALLFGSMDKFIIGILQILIVCILSIIGWENQWAVVFYLCSILGVSVVFIWQQILIYNRKPIGCLKAFMSNIYVGMLMFAGIFLNFFNFY